MIHFILLAKYTAIVLLVLLFAGSINENIMAQTFGAGAILGLNASQIDGDGSEGYNRAGIEIGLEGIIFTGERTEVRTGIIYSQRGALSNFLGYTDENTSSIYLQYVAIPLNFHLKDWLHENGYYKIHYYAGLSYGRLFEADVRTAGGNIAPNNYQQNDISWNAGLSYMINSSWSLGLKYTGSLNLLYDSRKFELEDFPSMRGYFLTLQLGFVLQ